MRSRGQNWETFETGSGHTAAVTTTREPTPDTDTVAFRGWWIVLWCTIARALTAPGQTIGVSAFTDHLIDGLGITRSTLSTAYLVGTLTGAIALPAIGRWVDRVGIRHAMTVVGIAFAAVVAYTGTVQNILMLGVAFIGLRMLGQGSLTLIAATGVAVWFERRRGFALALSATVSIGLLSLAPLTFGATIDAVGWRWAWVVLGIGVAVIVVPMARFGLVDRPEDIGQLPDGDPPDNDNAGVLGRLSMTVAQALRTPAFWTLGALTAMMSMTITGLTFHNTDMLAEQGLNEDEAAAIFIPQMIGSVSMGFLFGTLTDRVHARILMPIAGALLAAGMFMATIASPGAGAIRYGLLTGLGVGAISALGGALYPKWYGTAHIGSIKGVSLAIGVGASALGPLLLSVGNDVADSYEPVIAGCAVITAVLGALTLVIPTPERDPAPDTA